MLADPKFQVGTRPSGPLSLEAKRFIVQMYEQLHREAAVGVILAKTLDDFCDRIMADEHPIRRLEPEELAAEFADYFQSAPPGPAG